MISPYKFLTETIAPIPKTLAPIKPSMSRNETIAYWSIFAGGFLFALWISLASTGYSLDDEISHYLRSNQAWSQPERLLDVWTRPGRNLIHFFFAWMPLVAVRVVTLVMAAVVVWLTTKIAASLKLGYLWLIPLFVWFQPWYASLSGTVLTQTPFAITAILGIYWLLTGRLAASGFCWGYLSLIRHEAMAFSLMFFVWFALQGKWKGVLGVAAPIAIYNLIAYIAIRDIPLMVFFEPKPEGRDIYGSGSLFHFVPTTFWFAGPAIVLLTFLGLRRMLRDWKSLWPLVVFPLYWLMHTVIFWKGLFASGGYYQFLMPMAPGFAIGALYGIHTLKSRIGEKTTLWKAALSTVIAATIALPAIPTFVINSILSAILPAETMSKITVSSVAIRPFERDIIYSELDDAIAFVKRNHNDAPIVLCAHIYAEYAHDLWKQAGYAHLHYTRPAEQALGTIIIWEYKYADVNAFPKSELEPAESGWTRVKSYPEGAAAADESVVIYLKTAETSRP